MYRLDDALKAVGKPDTTGDSIKRMSEAIEEVAIAKSVVETNTAGYTNHRVRHRFLMLRECPVDLQDEAVTTAATEFGPAPEPGVIVDNIQGDTGKAAALRREQPTADRNLWMTIRVAIDRHVVLDAPANRLWQSLTPYIPVGAPISDGIMASSSISARCTDDRQPGLWRKLIERPVLHANSPSAMKGYEGDTGKAGDDASLTASAVSLFLFVRVPIFVPGLTRSGRRSQGIRSIRVKALINVKASR